jgi:hypothetical protein
MKITVRQAGDWNHPTREISAKAGATIGDVAHDAAAQIFPDRGDVAHEWSLTDNSMHRFLHPDDDASTLDESETYVLVSHSRVEEHPAVIAARKAEAKHSAKD